MLFEKTYTLRTESAEGIARYYISFNDGEKRCHEIEVSRPVYREFERFVRVERNLTRWDERHREQSEVWDETLNKRALYPPDSLEDTVFDCLRNEQLRLAIQQLSETQRRRFVLHHEFGLTYGQIAKMENCTTRAVQYSVDVAKKKVFDAMKNIL